MGKHVRLSVCESVGEFTHPDDGSVVTRRIYFLTARAVDSSRFWYDFSHFHVFYDQARAYAYLEKVEAAIGDATGRVLWERLASSPHWTRNVLPDPLDTLKPYGEEWEREQNERTYGYA